MRRIIRSGGAILLAVYAMHFAWEMAHASLFAPMDRLPFWQATAWCARAAGWDVLISVAAYSAAALAARRRLWIHHPRRWHYAVYFAIGLAITVAIEQWAISAGRWQYREAMPTIADIGLTPLLQWIVIPAATLAAVRRVARPAPASE